MHLYIKQRQFTVRTGGQLTYYLKYMILISIYLVSLISIPFTDLKRNSLRKRNNSFYFLLTKVA